MTRNNVISIWTEGRIEALKSLWAKGFSFSGIAAEMGEGVTRNAVCGKLFRLELAGRNPAPRTFRRRTEEEIEATKRAKMERRNERRRSQRVTVVRVRQVNLEALRCVEVISLNKTLLELGPNDCRYPFGDGPFTFCGNPQFEGSSYCGGHFGLTARRGQS